MDNITFQSKIKFIKPQEFNQKVKNLNPKKHFIGYPWSADLTRTGKNMYTTQIMDCIAGGIVQDGNVRMFHLATVHQKQAKKHHIKAFSIKDVERRILEGIDLAKENIHAFIFGGFQMEENSKYNVNKLNKIKSIFSKYNIPFSIIGARRDVHYFGRYSLFYENKNDTWFITNSLVNKGALDGNGNEIEINNDLITYNFYNVIRDKRGICSYPMERRTTNAEEYFKSQFRQVSLCKFDEFV